MTVIEGPSDAARARFLEVDGLKGLAVIAVVAYQIFRFSGFAATAPGAMARVLADASQGFCLFLMLAAFLFAYPLLTTLHAEGSAALDIGRYLCGRAIRIYPAYLVVVLLAASLHPLATLFGYPALAHASPPVDLGTFARTVFGAGGLGNDGLRAVGLFALAFALLPILLLTWTRVPRVAIFLAVVAAVLDTLTRAHASGIGLIVPLVLGIAAADARAREQRGQRFGLAIAAVAAILALVFETHIATLPGALEAPTALRIDPFWSLAGFGILIACGALSKVRLLLGFVAFRTLRAPAYAVTLVAMPIAGFAARQMPPQVGSAQATLVTAAVITVVALALWQSVDRAFGRETLRLRLATRPGAIVDRILDRARIATVTFRYPPPKIVRASEARDDVESASAERSPVPQAELARLSTRTGSPEDLAAEIFETKKRLTERAVENGAYDPQSSPLPAAFAPPHAPARLPRPIAAPQDEPAIENAPVNATPAASRIVEPEIALAEKSHQTPVLEFVAANATRVLEQHTVATLTALVESVEAERELEPAVARPAIRMRIGPPRTPIAKTPPNE